MSFLDPALLDQVRARFAHVESCPFAGRRVFFENAGGALTLKTVVETSARFAAIPDNQGRDNPASRALSEVIARARADMHLFFNPSGGQFIVGESGTELLFRLIRSATVAAPPGRVLGSTLEHPATRSAARHWARVTGRDHVLVAHDDGSGSVDAAAYGPEITADTRVATILHTSPVTGMGVAVAEIAAAIRAVAPDCLIIVDGIQRAAHGSLDLADCDIDGYVISPYKVFSRHGYGVAWVSARLHALAHEHLIDAPGDPWELGTRDTGSYATFSDVVAHFEWLGQAVGGAAGGAVGDGGERRRRIVAAGAAIHRHEAALTEAMIHGIGNHRGLADLPGVRIIGGADNPRREGLVSLAVDGQPAARVVEALGGRGIRTHTRKADHYSGNVLRPLGLDSAVRVSLCHYNSPDEVAAFLDAMREITVGGGI